ncbi:MAG: hypothetical protein Q9159_000854 [Coniocarpon cinnabarinum]
MSTDLLRPPAHLSEADALRLSQQAPAILRKQSSWSLPWPLSLLVANDGPEKWAIHENLFYSCLRAGDDKSAFACLERLKARFGEDNERVMGLVGLYHEAMVPDKKGLDAMLKSYEQAMEEKPTNMIIRKRHAALLKSMGHADGAISALVDFLEVNPVDAEAWMELCELYFSQALYSQAIYCLEEALIIMPNAWNIHARLGEIVYISTAASTNESALMKGFARALKCFCRSVELCEDYLRGYYGMKLSTSKLLQTLQKTSPTSVVSREVTEDEFAPPPLPTVQRLNELATSRLAEIVRKASLKTSGWEGYEEAEVIAARELLDRDGSSITR